MSQSKQSKRQKLAVIIPAYNEEKTVGSVLDAVREVPEVEEIIVVSDGSTDSTVREARRRRGVTVIELTENRGKGAAMKAGIDATDADVVVFLDADLIGLNRGHLRQLIAPVLAGEADMSIGLFGGGRLATDLAQIVTPFLSGQRAVKKPLLADLDEMEVVRFGIEVALTRKAQKAGMRVRQVVLDQLTHVTKEEKRGFWKGLRDRLKMYWEIVRYAQRSS